MQTTIPSGPCDRSQWPLPSCPLGSSRARPSPWAQTSPRLTPGEARPLPWTTTRGRSVQRPLGGPGEGAGLQGQGRGAAPGTALGPPPRLPLPQARGCSWPPAHHSTCVAVTVWSLLRLISISLDLPPGGWSWCPQAPHLRSTCTAGPSLLLNEETESGCWGRLNQAPGGKVEGLEPPTSRGPVGQRTPSLPSCSRLPTAVSTSRARPPLPLPRGCAPAPPPTLPQPPSQRPFVLLCL